MDLLVQTLPEFLVTEDGSTDKAIPGRTLLSKPGIDDRKSRRYTVPQVRQPCELKVGANVLSATLENESKDGFSVLIDRLDGLKAGQKAAFHAYPGWFIVRIVYITKVTPPENAAPECDSWFRVGMKVKRRLQQQRISQ
jgi:hypothetical protein